VLKCVIISHLAGAILCGLGFESSKCVNVCIPVLLQVRVRAVGAGGSGHGAWSTEAEVRGCVRVA